MWWIIGIIIALLLIYFLYNNSTRNEENSKLQLLQRQQQLRQSNINMPVYADSKTDSNLKPIYYPLGDGQAVAYVRDSDSDYPINIEALAAEYNLMKERARLRLLDDDDLAKLWSLEYRLAGAAGPK